MTWFQFIIGANVAAWAFVAFLVVFVAVRRLRPREPESEPLDPSTPSPRTGTVLLRMVRQLVHRRRKAPSYEGATEDYGAELRSLRNIPVSPDLASTSEVDIRAEVHDALWDPISAAIDDFDAALEAVLDRLLADDPQLRIRLPASVDDTGQYEVAELEALLAEEVGV